MEEKALSLSMEQSKAYDLFVLFFMGRVTMLVNFSFDKSIEYVWNSAVYFLHTSLSKCDPFFLSCGLLLFSLDVLVHFRLDSVTAYEDYVPFWMLDLENYVSCFVF